MLALDEALTKLEQQNQRRAQLVKLRFFAGFTITQAAEAVGISESTADNDWAYARSWLRLEIAGGGRVGALSGCEELGEPGASATGDPSKTPVADAPGSPQSGNFHNP